ncbi:MAG TPA: alpha/beta hydrolase [Ktedonosporobacter sp.]|nr:alpha/beta hydrolase [Ktedonosporobacter sp.]
MAHYVELHGIRTWYDEQGAGEPLVLFHPGGVGVDSRAFGPNLSALASHFHVFLPERRGHGHTPDADGPYSFELMAEDMIHFLEQVVGGPARIFGVSDGSIVALLVAHKRPDLVQRLICAAGPFHRSGWVASAIEPGQGTPEFLIISYGEVSPDGQKHFKVVEQKLDQMHALGPTLTMHDLKNISCRTLVMISDDDEVPLEHAIDFYRAMPDSELAVIPGTSHGLLVEKPDLCNKILVDFLTLDPVTTFAPIRRA